MEQSIQRKGLVNWLLLLVLGVSGAVAAQYAGCATGLVAAVFIGMGLLVSLIAYFQMRLEQRERLEQMEFDELKKTATSGSLFNAPEAESFPARRSREQFEKYFVPAFGILLFGLQVAAVYFLWKLVGEDKSSNPRQATVAMAINGLSALIYYQFGKYSAVLARLEKVALLRPQASYLLLGSVLSVVTAAVEIAGWAQYPKVDGIVARVLIVTLGLVAVENLITLVFEIYRPRVKGQAEHPLYESRLIGILSQPGGLITTAAQALDYQFGFKVSETWFYKFLEGALAWIVLVQLGVLVLSTCIVIIGPGEQALLQRFGKPTRGVLNPGPHLKLPWPIDRVQRFEADRVHMFTVGIETEEGQERQRVLVWGRAHAKEEFDLLVASREQQATNSLGGEATVPVNLLAVNLPVQFQIRDLEAYAYNYADANALLKLVASSELTRYLVSVDINDIMATGRRKAAADLLERIQQRADELKLGVRILFVGLHGIHPPVKVAADFERVIGALQDREATNHYARAYAAEMVPLAKAEAARRINEAQAYLHRATALAAASSARFTNQLAAYEASPSVYKHRLYLESLIRGMAGDRKYVVVPTNLQEVIVLNLEDKLREDLSDLKLTPAPKK